MGRLNEAIQIYLELKNHISKDYRLYYELGMSLVLNRQYFKAIESFETSIKENPKSTASYKRLGELNYNLGKVYEAKKMFMKADALNNRSVMTIKFLACSYIILDNDIDSAVLQLMRLPEFRGKKGKPQYSHYKSILNPPINLINPNTITFREAQ
jgi:tetratricopeptide (TPR) repeat protein